MSAYEFLQVHTHELEPDPIPDEATNEDNPVDVTDSEPSDTLLINSAKGSRPNPLPPGDIQRVLSKNSRAQSIQPTLNIRYHTIRPQQANPYHSWTEALMVVLQVQTSVSSLKLDELLISEELIIISVPTLTLEQSVEESKPRKAPSLVSCTNVPCSTMDPPSTPHVSLNDKK
jgi:hypothetical protein